jgi:hypothetical protein
MQYHHRHSVLESIKHGYTLDEYCAKLACLAIPGTKCINGLWYVSSHLLIPWTGDIYKNLFCLAHDSLGHFGTDKSYAVLHNTYYWPNM